MLPSPLVDSTALNEQEAPATISQPEVQHLEVCLTGSKSSNHVIAYMHSASISTVEFFEHRPAKEIAEQAQAPHSLQKMSRRHIWGDATSPFPGECAVSPLSSAQGKHLSIP